MANDTPIRRDYVWAENNETHARRRDAILKKYPQIRQLMIHDPWLKWKVLSFVAIQLASYYPISFIQNFWILLLLAFFFNGVLNAALLMAIHDISHNAAFGYAHPLANALFGIVAGLPIGFPISGTFRKDHPVHHRRLGKWNDPDVPLPWEGRFFQSTPRKFVYLLLFPMIYASRSSVHGTQPVTMIEVFGIVVQAVFDFLIVRYLGWHMLLYILGSTWICTGLNPVSAHFLTEHSLYFFESDYLKKVSQLSKNKCLKERCLVPDTFSYYGPLNWLMFHVGYHVEHHDFPSIPGRLLPKVREIASEYYEPLCHHTSWTMALVRFVFDSRMSPFSRIRRKEEQLGHVGTDRDDKTLDLDMQFCQNSLIKQNYIFYQ